MFYLFTAWILLKLLNIVIYFILYLLHINIYIYKKYYD